MAIERLFSNLKTFLIFVHSVCSLENFDHDSLMGADNEVDSKTVNWGNNLSGCNSDMPVTPSMMA